MASHNSSISDLVSPLQSMNSSYLVLSSLLPAASVKMILFPSNYFQNLNKSQENESQFPLEFFH